MKQEISKLFNNEVVEKQFNKIKISLASPEKIKSWSFGEIKKKTNFFQKKNIQRHKKNTESMHSKLA